MERRVGLVVLQSSHQRAVDDELVVLQLAADDAVRVLRRLVEHVDFAGTRRIATRHPAPVAVVVD